MTHALTVHRIAPQRTWRVVAAVLLAHALLGWVVQSRDDTWQPAASANSPIMAEVLMDVPSSVVSAANVSVANVSTAGVPAKPRTPSAPSRLDANPTPAPSTASSAAQASHEGSATASRTSEPTLVLPSADAAYLQNPPPLYPRMSRRLGEQGTVVVRVLINAQGLPERVELRHSSGFALLDQSALEAVPRWRFVPGHRNGVPEAMWFNVPVRFVLE